MALYTYVAMDIAGNRISGEMDACNKDDLTELLNRKGYVLLSQKKNISLTEYFSKKIKSKDIIILSRQLSVMVSAGISIQEAIHLLADGTEKKVIQDNLLNIYDDLKAGFPLSEAMKRRDVFDDFMIGMVKVGEFSGAFDDVMRRVADFYENDGKIKRSVRSALIYPILLCIMAVVVVIFLLVKIIPTFEGMFSSQGAELPALTRAVTAASDFLVANWILLLSGVVVVVILSVMYVRSPKGKYKTHGFLLKLPVVGKLIIKLTTSRFARCMDILMKSGVTLVQSFELMDSMISNLVIRENFQLCKEGIMAGYTYAASLKRVGYFPPMLISMVIVGETTGSLAEVFDKTSSYFDDEATEAIKAMILMIEPIILLFIGAAVTIIILSIMLPMVDMLSLVG